MLRKRARIIVLGVVVFLIASAQRPAPLSPADTPPDGMVRLPGHVLAALAKARRVEPADARTRTAEANERLLLTIVLKRSDQAGFDHYLREVYDSYSPAFHHFLTPEQVSGRFGPSRGAYDTVLHYLQGKGFSLVDGSSNRLALVVRGTRAQAERAFNVRIKEFALGGRRFFSNDSDPGTPWLVGGNLQAVIGLSNLAVPKPADLSGADVQNLEFLFLKLAFISLQLRAAQFPANANLILDFLETINKINAINSEEEAVVTRGFGEQRNPAVKSAPAAAGAGQTIGLPSFSSIRMTDVADWLALAGLPANLVGQVSQVAVGGGAPLGPNQSDVLLSINTILGLAPGAKIVVYEGPLTAPGASFQALFNRMITDRVTIIGNTFGYCEDQTTAADAESVNAVLATAAASGISVLSATGDYGSSCQDGGANTIAVPADSPNVTAVGGTSPTVGPGFTYQGEAYFSGAALLPPAGPSGFGTSRFFSRPAYQSLVETGEGRSVPDVVAIADPNLGATVCEADAGGCPSQRAYGGTSLATAVWAAYVAILNRVLGHPLGFLNKPFYRLAGTAAFRTAASMHSDFAHVGLGSANLDLLALSLAGRAPGPVSNTVSSVMAASGLPFVPFFGSVPADGTATGAIIVRLHDAKGNMIAGKSVALSAESSAHAAITPKSGVSSAADGSVSFSVKDTSVENVTFTATDTTDGVTLAQTATVDFAGPPAASGGIFAAPTTVKADGKSTTTITVKLEDANRHPAPDKLILLSQGDGASQISATTATTDATGSAAFTATDSVEQSVTYTAIDITDGDLAVPGSASVDFVHAIAPPSCNIGLGKAAVGFKVTTFASGFPNNSCIGPIGMAFDARGNFLVTDFPTGVLYKFPPKGGAAGPAVEVGNTGIFGLAGLAFTADGRLYAADQSAGTVVELDPATAAVLRTVGSVPVATGIQVDPLSKDLFVSGDGFLCFRNPGMYRMSGYASGPGTVTKYFSPACDTAFDGFVFAPDGTIYTEASPAGTDDVFSLTGTSGPAPPEFTGIANVPTADGIALEPNPKDPSHPFLYVNANNGTITKLDTSTSPAPATPVYGGGSRGDFVTVGPDGCLYATQTDRVIKVTNADGSCGLVPVSPFQQIVLTPMTVAPNPAQGTPQRFTATFRNVTASAGTPLTLSIIGPNYQVLLSRTNPAGQATFTYAGTFTGTDTLTARASVGSQSLVSNPANVTWVSGPHTTFVSLNASPKAGIAGKAQTLKASLFDISLSPPAAVRSQSVIISLAGHSCSALTNVHGDASCALTPNGSGIVDLSADFVGIPGLLPAKASVGFDLTAPTPMPSPTPKNTPRPTPTATRARTRTPTRTPTTRITRTRTYTPTRTHTQTPARTPRSTPTRTHTRTPARTTRKTPTRTHTRTPTRTPTRTRRPTATATRRPTPTPTPMANFRVAMVGDDASGTKHGLQVMRIEDSAGRALPVPAQTLVPIATAPGIAGLALTPDGSHGAVVDGGNLVYFFSSNLATSKVNLLPATVNVTGFGGDGDSVASLPGGNDVVVSAGGSELALISGIATSKPVVATSIPTSNRGVEYDGLVISSDGKVMLSRSGAGGLLDVYSVTPSGVGMRFDFSFRLVKTLTVAAASSLDGHEGMALSPTDSSRAVIVGANGTATLITGLPARPLVHAALKLPGVPNAVTISRDGKYAIVALSGGLLVLKGVNTGALALAGSVYSPTFSTPAGACKLNLPYTLGVMADGKFVVTIQDCHLQQFNTAGTGVLLTIPFSAGALAAPAGQLNYVVTPLDDQLVTH